MAEKYYNINQIAEMFGVTRTTVYEWMNTGRLGYVVIGARRRITQSALDAFVQTGTPKRQGENSEKNVMPGLLALATQ